MNTLGDGPVLLGRAVPSPRTPVAAGHISYDTRKCRAPRARDIKACSLLATKRLNQTAFLASLFARVRVIAFLKVKESTVQDHFCSCLHKLFDSARNPCLGFIHDVMTSNKYTLYHLSKIASPKTIQLDIAFLDFVNSWL